MRYYADKAAVSGKRCKDKNGNTTAEENTAVLAEVFRNDLQPGDRVRVGNGNIHAKYGAAINLGYSDEDALLRVAQELRKYEPKDMGKQRTYWNRVTEDVNQRITTRGLEPTNVTVDDVLEYVRRAVAELDDTQVYEAY